MDLAKIHRIIRRRMNKQFTGSLSPSDIDDALESAQLVRYCYLIGKPEMYQPSRAVPPVYAQATNKVSDDMRMFLTPDKELAVSSGQFTLPPNYMHHSALRTESGTDIDVVSDGELADRLKSVVVAPTTTDPVARVFETYGRVYPDTITKVVLNYYRRPQSPLYAETGTGREAVYSQNNSKQLEWPDSAVMPIINLAVQFLSQQVKDQEGIAITEALDRKGQ